MQAHRSAARAFLVLILAGAGAAAAPAAAGQTSEQFTPKVGQAGKDVVWVPTSPRLVEAMLDLAAVTPADFVVDLGSGDGRNVIAAARRGARALGVEYNPDMVALSRRLAAEAGVAERATFVQGDMFEAEFSQATVLALFLLPDNMKRLAPKFLALKPGTRIVGNTFGVEGWEADETIQLDDDEPTGWKTALLWIVPARVAGKWRMGDDELALAQEFQRVSGTITREGRTRTLQNVRIRGADLQFRLDGLLYTGRVTDGAMQGSVLINGQERQWSAARLDRP
jgi:SAM-dependent methyltransferase